MSWENNNVLSFNLENLLGLEFKAPVQVHFFFYNNREKRVFLDVFFLSRGVATKLEADET